MIAQVSFIHLVFVFMVLFSYKLKKEKILQCRSLSTRGQHKQPEAGSSDEGLVHPDAELYCPVSGRHPQPGVPRRSH